MDVEAEQIARELDVATRLPPSLDVLFVFGIRLTQPALLAADLVNQGVARYVVLTGGRNPVSGMIEAEAHLAILLSHGVPPERIVLEDQSSNTLQNVTYSVPKLLERVSSHLISSVGVVAKWYHCRRAMMTLKRHLPMKVKLFAVPYEPDDIGRSNWWQTPEGRKRVLAERDRIPRYLAKGDIAHIQEIDGGYV